MSDLRTESETGRGDGVGGSVVTAAVGLLYVILGVALLLHGLDVLTLRWELVGPAVLVLLGAFLLIGGLAAARR